MPARREYIALASSPSVDEPEKDPLSTVHTRRERCRYESVFELARTHRVCITAALLLTVAATLVFHISSLRPEIFTVVDVPANPYFSTGDPKVHNTKVLARLAHCRGVNLLRNTSSPHLEPLSAEEEARRQSYGCGTNTTTLIILSSIFFSEAFIGQNTAGEVIYAQSVISTLNYWGYSYVFTSLGWYNHDMRYTSEIWNEWSGSVRMIMADPEQVDECWKNVQDGGCVKSENNVDGIPAWKLMSFWYWDDARNPLGPAFTLSPSPYNNNTLLSYSIEPTCSRIASSRRPERPQAYLLAKQGTYFQAPRFSWSIPFFGTLHADLDINVVVGMKNTNETISEQLQQAGIVNHGRLSKMDFYRKLGQSFVLIGVGQPRISPSPWDALCLGVPFINPILEWAEEDPDDRSRWHAQQWRMTSLDPLALNAEGRINVDGSPYVYHVHAHDLAALSTAIDAALRNPIDSYIPDHMRFATVCGFMADVLARDWKAEAEAVANSGEAQTYKTLLL